MVTVVSLLYMSSITENNFVNISAASHSIYYKMFEYRCDQLNRLNINHVVMCDAKTALRYSAYRNLKIVVVEDISAVPSFVPFKNAYNKLNFSQVFDHVRDNFLLFLDLDVFIDEQKFKTFLISMINAEGFFYYDIADEMQSAIFTHDSILESSRHKAHIWVGGEVFGISRGCRSEFDSCLSKVLEEHVAHIAEGKIFNYGDEIVLTQLVSSAPKFRVSCFDKLVVKRFWTVPVEHKRKLFDVIPFRGYVFYHFPSEKRMFSIFYRYKVYSVFLMRVYITLSLLRPVNLLGLFK